MSSRTKSAAQAALAVAVLLGGGQAIAATLEFSRESVSVPEDRARARFLVTRTGDTSGPASVDFATAAGSALPGSDFRARSGTLVWAAGDATRRTISVPVIDDAAAEPAETFTVTLAVPAGDVLGTLRTARGRIRDNDGTPPFAFESSAVRLIEGGTATLAVVRSDASAFGFVSVCIEGGTASRAAEAGSPVPGDDYDVQRFATLDFDAGVSRRTLDIPTLQDPFDEPDETIFVELRECGAAPGPRAVITLADDDSVFSIAQQNLRVAERNAEVSLTVERRNGATGAASVRIDTVDGTAIAGSDYVASGTTLSWPDGDDTPRTVPLRTLQDARNEGDEGFHAVLSAPAGGVIRGNPAATVVIEASDGGSSGFRNTFNARSPLGDNLSFVTDYTNEYPFANYFKNARFWTSVRASDGVGDDRPFALDPDFHVTRLRSNQVARTFLFTNSGGEPLLAGLRLVLRHDGEGELRYVVGARVLERTPGRDVIELTHAAGEQATLAIDLVATTEGNHLRNIRLTREGGICRGNPLRAVAAANACPAGDFTSFEDAASRGEHLFNPEFLDSIRNYAALRFLNWQFLNRTSATEFADRRRLSHAFWSSDGPGTPVPQAVLDACFRPEDPVDDPRCDEGLERQYPNRGVPIEIIVALANLMDLDPWVHIPHRASDDFVRRFGRVFAQGLEPGRRVYIEFTNENWNFLFPQATFIRNRSIELGLDVPVNQGFLRLYSQRSQEVFDLFGAEFGAARPARVYRMLATQSAIPFFTSVILAETAAADKADYFAIAPYFGSTIPIGDEVFSAAQRAAEFRRLCASNAQHDAVFDWLANDTNAILNGSLADLDAEIGRQKEVVDRLALPLITYEGGQHFVTAGDFANDADLNACMDDVNRDPRMRGLYRDYLANWRSRSDEIFFHLMHVEPWGVFGRWGSKEFLSQPREQAPKFDALQTYIETQPLE